MIWAALLLVIGSKGATMGEVRALVPLGLRPPPMPAPAKNGWDQMKLVCRTPIQRGNAPTLTTSLKGWPTPDSEEIADARAMLKPYEMPLQRLDAALARPFWAAPRKPDSLRPTMNDLGELDFPELARLKELAKALSLRAQLNLAEGRPDEAIADVRRGFGIGSRLGAGRSRSIPYLVGIAIESIAMSTATSLSSYPNLDDQTLAALQAIVAVEPDPARLSGTLRIDFDDSFVTLVAASPTHADDAGDIPSELSSLGKALKGVRILDRSDTIATAGSFLSAARENRKLPWSKQIDLDALATSLTPKAPSMPEPKPGQKPTPAQERRIVAWFRANPNAMGRQLAVTMGPVYGSMEGAERRTLARRRLTATSIALLRYHLRKGSLPTVLDELAIEDLTQPPHYTDPFSDRDLGYDPARRILWSIGEDGKDDDGTAKDGSKPDIVLKLK